MLGICRADSRSTDLGVKSLIPHEGLDGGWLANQSASLHPFPGNPSSPNKEATMP